MLQHKALLFCPVFFSFGVIANALGPTSAVDVLLLFCNKSLWRESAPEGNNLWFLFIGPDRMNQIVGVKQPSAQLDVGCLDEQPVAACSVSIGATNPKRNGWNLLFSGLKGRGRHSEEMEWKQSKFKCWQKCQFHTQYKAAVTDISRALVYTPPAQYWSLYHM